LRCVHRSDRGCHRFYAAIKSGDADIRHHLPCFRRAVDDAGEQQIQLHNRH
jgi:hypothetical protein